MRRIFLTVLSLLACIMATTRLLAVDVDQPSSAEARKLMEEGNYQDALAKFRELTLGDAASEPQDVAEDVRRAISCMQQLNQADQIDGYREEVVEKHSDDWIVLAAVAQTYLDVDHQGFLIAGQFRRGQHRGGGEAVHASARDRVEGLRLFRRAVDIVAKNSEAQKSAEAAALCDRFASALLSGRGYRQAWQLQVLTDLEELPDYEQGWWYNDSAPQGAPVDADGNPVYYEKPASWDDSSNDGERWRWLLALRTSWQPDLRFRELRERAAFLESQFGVQTMADYGWWFARRTRDSAADAAKSTLDLHTLGEDETIAKLATGIKRFKLPDEHNPIRLYRQIMTEARDNADQWRGAAESLANIFENRRQYPQAAELWRQLVGSGGVGLAGYVQRLAQITGNWGRFEPTLMQPAGRGATLEFRYRNGKHVEFTAHAVKVAELLADVKKYLASSPKQLDWEQLNIDNLGYRLVTGNQEKYLGPEAARWSLELAPRPNHFDRRITVTTPLQKAGAYLVTAKMADGNVNRVVVWIADTAIVKKPLENKALYYIADAVTGKPIPKANVEFFGFFAEPRDQNRNAFRINTKNFAENSSAQGFVELPASEELRKYQWIATATTADGRLAYLGYSGVWPGHYLEQEYKQVKVFTVTDRPVYRPAQEVHYKFWVAAAQYDQPNDSPFAGKSFAIEIHNPLGEKVHSESLVADGYGGLAGTWKLPAGATLGAYRITVANHGGGSFRVEEYKKPEYEVAIDAPEKPVQLGDKITAKISARYYFGEPVVQARVKYKVLRTPHTDRWFPAARWDWLYGPGYWWFTEDYAWYPGWSRWGCERPSPWWFWRQPTPPEVVAEAETEIGSDGAVEIEIDTAAAKEFHPDEDHTYEIQAEVVDQSRRTITASGRVLVAREPFQVCVWAHRGYYRAGDTMQIHMAARTLDGKPVKGDGLLRLLRIAYQDGKPVENEVAKWTVATDAAGRAEMQIKAAAPGQYRVSYQVTVDKPPAAAPRADGPPVDEPLRGSKTTVEGAQLLVVRGENFDGADFRFNNLEIIADKAEYAPGDKVALQVSANRADAAVLLFLRPANGVYLPPQFVQLKGKSTIVEFPVELRDMPNFFVEAVTVHSGRLHSAVREIFVPPAKRVFDVEVLPSAEAYLPGQHAKVKLKLTDPDGKPVIGSMAVAVYDKALDYIAGGDQSGDIREFFWKWRRNHHPQSETNLGRTENPVAKGSETEMQNIGVFGESGADQDFAETRLGAAAGRAGGLANSMSDGAPVPAAPMAASAVTAAPADPVFNLEKSVSESGAGAAEVQPAIRENFADTALWVGAIETNSDGLAEVELDMPENLTAWKINVWGMSHSTRVGQGAAEVVTRKNLVVRLQAPRFFVERDEVVLSANVHNYLDAPKQVRVRLELDGDCLERVGDREKVVQIPANGEHRVDWRVKAIREGEATVRMLALTDEESDAMQMKFPVLVHGMLKTESFTGVIRPEDELGKFTFTIPAERRVEQTRLEVRYSPTLAGAMLDALPHLIDYPYGCTEQTLNRFLPAVLTQRTLQQMGIDLTSFKNERANLNSQEIAESAKAKEERDRKLRESRRNVIAESPVFDDAVLADVVKTGVNRLTEMQLSDGGWGWFSGWGEHSSAHTTAIVVRGLLIAKQNDVAIVSEVLDRGIAWLRAYQQRQLAALDNWDRETNKRRDDDKPAKSAADNLDALVYLVLTEAAQTPAVSRDAAAERGAAHRRLRDYLYQDRTKLAPYSLATFGLALHYELQPRALPGGNPAENRDFQDDAKNPRPEAGATGNVEQTQNMLAMVMRNLSQYVKQDDENQTAWLDLPDGYWWYWYGSEYEAHAYYLKLLAAHEPQSEVAPRLVKYLLNNRKHATYWNSTRDTALVVEAFADYLKATGETKPNYTLEVLLDGKLRKSVEITADSLFTFDDALIIEGESLASGEHTVELRKKGDGPVYWSGYLTNFTLEDDIKATGLELKVDRRYYKITAAEKTSTVAGGRGQAINEKVEKYDRTPIESLDTLASGDLVEVELLIDSKNDYEYIILDDMKAAGFEPVEVRSGYNGNELGAYVEYRDQRVALFCRTLARGQHSVSYRLRAEIPGKFSALPTKAYAMYAPELKANSDEFKIRISDDD